jgi:cyanophycinase
MQVQPVGYELMERRSHWRSVPRARGLARTAVARAACLLMFLAALAGGQSTARGTLFIVGGGPQPPALVEEFVKLAGGPGRAKIAVFAMASSDGATGGEEKAADLRALGATARNVWITHAQAQSDSAVRLLDGVTGIWFGGGDQTKLADVLNGTATLRAIRARFAAGAVVGGTSAGAAVLSTPMLTGDERHPGGDRPPADSSEAWLTIARDNVITADGFGFITDAIIDQHFVRRKRHNRLVSLVLERPQRLGVGIDESTALLIGPDGIWRVLGASVVVVYDARDATISPTGKRLGATGIVMHILPAGARFNPHEGEATLP